jgi:hypothetical protein
MIKKAKDPRIEARNRMTEALCDDAITGDDGSSAVGFTGASSVGATGKSS